MLRTIVTREHDLFHGFCMLLGCEGEYWIYLLPIVDEYSDPAFCHQN